MNRKCLVLLAGIAHLLVVPFLDAQQAFEVASVRASEPITTPGVTAGVHIDGAQVRCVELSLRDYVRMAYKVKDYQIEGPEWMASARFDILAKLPEGATPEQVPQMVGALLADRFQMKMHRASKEFPVYGLVVAKGGLKLKPLPEDPEAEETAKGTVNVVAGSTNGGTVIDLGKGSSISLGMSSANGSGKGRIEAKKVTMAAFADVLARFTDRPVVDFTEVKGSYDFALEFAPEDFRAMMLRAAQIAGVALPPEALKLLDNASGDAMFAALETLGLKMEPRKASLEVLEIDHMEKTPSEN
jgi:uncharacterized protein (TIGR03435 family)